MVQSRVTQKEYEALQKLANKNGYVSVSEFTRELILKALSKKVRK